jgi:hypothetical protein
MNRAAQWSWCRWYRASGQQHCWPKREPHQPAEQGHEALIAHVGLVGGAQAEVSARRTGCVMAAWHQWAHAQQPVLAK